jgi:hypothetical protein
MTDPRRPLPLQDVYAIVEQRRRQRARRRAIVAPAAAVGAAGAAALVVVVIQAGGTPPAPAAAPPAALATSPHMPATQPTTGASSNPARPTTTAPPFDESWLDPDLLPGLANSLFDRSDAEQTRLLAEASTLASTWGVPMYPAAKAVVAKADALGARIDPADRNGADKLINRFEAAGYTEDYAVELAGAWDTDPRTAEIVGALVIEAGCCG